MKLAHKQGTRNQIGAYGEEIAASYLKKQGFTILETNYNKPWGEIDLVARETASSGSITHFVEVKTVSYETKRALQKAVASRAWRPEEQVTQQKLQKLHRTIETWLSERGNTHDWQLDVLAVRLVLQEKYASVTHIPNIIL